MDRRLTNTQFEHALFDIFGVQVEAELSSDSSSPFDVATEVSIEDSVAISMAATAAAAAFNANIACVDDQTPRQCAEVFADRSGRLALRGQHDVDALMDTYDAAGSFDAGIRAIVAQIVQEPNFVMVTPSGEPEGPNVRLDGFSVATRLSLLIWNSLPDEELLDVVDALSDSEVLSVQVERMLSDPRFLRAQADLYGQLTRVDEVAAQDRGAVDPSWSASLGALMLEEQRRFVMSELSDADATLESLLTSRQTFTTPELAALYGDDVVAPASPDGSWDPVQLDPERRGGLLTQLGFVTQHSRDLPAQDYQPPTRRGMGVLQAFFCTSEFPPPPIPTPIGSIDSREAWEAEVETRQECAGCHVVPDPPGHAFGHYDGLGRWSPTSDSTAAMVGDVAFDDAVELGEQLGTSDDTLGCLARQHYAFALRRLLDAADECAIDGYVDAFVDSGGNIRALVAAIATSESFQLARP